MKSFVIVGVGRFGTHLAKTLVGLGHEVLAIDDREEHIQKISEFVTHAVVGDIKDEAVLRSLGVRNYDIGIVTISEDIATSVLVTTILKELGMKYVMVRATSELHMKVLQKIGADKIVFLEKDMGTRLAQSLAVVNILDYIELSDNYSIVEIRIPQSWIGKSLRELNVRVEYGVNVVALKKISSGDIEAPPNPDMGLTNDNIIVVIGSNDDIKKITD